MDNLVSQAQKVNLSEFIVVENEWAKALGNGKKVTVDIDINYTGPASRPSSFDVSYTIDDIPFFKHIENQEVIMKEKFEDKFMDIQTELISLCLEVTDSKVDKIFAYASIEAKSTMFNAFFEKQGKILTINQLSIDRRMTMNFLRVGTTDLEKVKKLCSENETKTPTEIKMYYETKTGKIKADYKYEEVCSEKTGISSGEVFMKWLDEIKTTL